MTLHDIPGELKALIQWCVWRYELPQGETKPTKVPYNPVTGAKVASNDPQTWCSFEQAAAAADGVRYAGAGFVFTSRDEYCGIDLDDPFALKDDGTPKFPPDKQAEIAARHGVILSEIGGYAEWSPSGKGMHILTKAKVPHGRRRDAVEVYSDGRYFTMTGNVYRNEPIIDAGEKVNLLWSQMSPQVKDYTNGFAPDFMQNEDDATIFNMAATAVNGDKFTALYNGNWSEYYSSQSEADFALIDIIGYYTQFTPQIMRMFRDSALGKRKKAERDNYLLPMIARAFDNQVPPIDFSALIDQFEAARAAAHTPTVQAQGGPAPSAILASGPSVANAKGERARLTAEARSPVSSWSLTAWKDRKPPGFLSVLLDYIYASSARPVYEISLVAALGLMSGIVGRQYNISKTGLNQYLMLIADTGKGKDAIASGVARVVTATKKYHERITEVYGPAQIMSGQALVKYLSSRNVPCFISLTGEFGIRLKQITDENASSADKTLMMVLLDLYMKSGAGQTVQPSIYADKANNTEQINSPAFTMIGETTGEKFYEALDESAVTSGLLPRFLIVEYDGNRPPLNPHAETVEVPISLCMGLAELMKHIEDLAQRGVVVTCGQYPDAAKMLNELDKFCDDQINHASRNLTRELWNRVHLKTLRLAALLAVCSDFATPIITVDMVEWAASMVLSDTNRLLGKFDRGEMGKQDETDNQSQEQYIRKFIGKYVRIENATDLPTGTVISLWQNKAINMSVISQKCGQAACFRKDRRGSTTAISATLKTLCEHGYLRRMSPVDTKALNYAGSAFQIIDPTWFFEA